MRRLTPLMAVFTLLLSACGTETPDAVASLEEETTTTSTTTPAQAVDEIEETVLAFAECLRGEGFEVDDPELDGEGQYHFRQLIAEPGQPLSEEAQAALAVCEPLVEGIAMRFEQADEVELTDNLMAFAQCMRDGGLTDWPDPDPNFERGTGSGGHIPGLGPFGDVSLDLRDPVQQALFDSCRRQFNVGPQD
jgi:hypothetical protein